MEDSPCVPELCEHHYIAIHEPGHLVYWVRVCQFCHNIDWADLDEMIGKYDYA